MTEDWLIAYEAYRKNWLNFGTRNIIDTNEFFDILNYFNINFYDSSKQVNTSFSVSPPPEIEPDNFDAWFDDFLNSNDDDKNEEEKAKY